MILVINRYMYIKERGQHFSKDFIARQVEETTSEGATCPEKLRTSDKSQDIDDQCMTEAFDIK